MTFASRWLLCCICSIIPRLPAGPPNAYLQFLIHSTFVVVSFAGISGFKNSGIHIIRISGIAELQSVAGALLRDSIVANTSASDCLDRLVSEMTYYTSSVK